MSGPSLGVPGPPATGYYDFLRNWMGIPATYLPDDSFWVGATYNLSLDIVNINLEAVPQIGDSKYPDQYALAVYNLAGDRMIAFAQDPVNTDGTPVNPYPPGSQPPTGYFEYLRQKFKIDSFSPGVITYTADVTTSVSFMVPDWMKSMTMSDMENLKTPWGRRYIAIAQQYGPTVVGIT